MARGATPKVPEVKPATGDAKPPEGDTPKGTVRRPSKKAVAKKKEGDFNAEMVVLRMSLDSMSPEDVRAGVLGAVERHGEGRVFEALRALDMPEELLAPAIPATTQAAAPVTSADNSLPPTDPAAQPAAQPAAPAAPAAAQALPTPGTFTVRDLLAGKVAVPEATTPEAAAPKADNAGQPTPQAAESVTREIQQSRMPGRGGVSYTVDPNSPMSPDAILGAMGNYNPNVVYQPGVLEGAFGPGSMLRSELTPGEVMGQMGGYDPGAVGRDGNLEPAFGPGFPPSTPAESVASPLIGLSEQAFPTSMYEPSVQVSNAIPNVRLVNPVLPKANRPPASMEEIMLGLGMREPAPDAGRMQTNVGEALQRQAAGVEDGTGTFVVNTPRPGIKQMQDSLQQADQPQAPAAPKKSIYETLGMNPPADMGTSGAYKNIPTALKATGILGLLGAGAYGVANYMGAFGGQTQDQPQGEQEDEFEQARRILMTPMKFE
jgi:hypothetical protein